MYELFKRQVALIWIAMLCVLFSALAPTIAHAMAGSQQSMLAMDICRADRALPGGDAQVEAGKAPSENDLHSVEHCPYCATHGSMLMLLSGVRFVFPLPELVAAYPILFYQSSAPLFSWNARNPRAPPALA